MLYKLIAIFGGSSLALITTGCNVAPNSPNASSAVGCESSYDVPSSRDVSQANNFQKTTILEGLERPWSMA